VLSEINRIIYYKLLIQQVYIYTQFNIPINLILIDNPSLFPGHILYIYLIDMRNHMYVTWDGMRMIILVVLSIRTSYILFSLCSLSRLCRSKGLHVSTTSAVSLVGSVEIQGLIYIHVYLHVRMHVYEMCARTPEGLGDI